VLGAWAWTTDAACLPQKKKSVEKARTTHRMTTYGMHCYSLFVVQGEKQAWMGKTAEHLTSSLWNAEILYT